MKKIIAFIPVYILYYIGDRLSKFDSLGSYKAYNWFMQRSVQLQDWAKLNKPWEHIDN